MGAPHYPPYGLHLPCRRCHAIDGDTVEVGFISDRYKWRIRLIDCWAHEVRTPIGYKAKEIAQEFIDLADNISVYVPLPEKVHDLMAGMLDQVNPIKLFTFERIPGHVFLREDQTLNKLMVDAGYASTRKGGQLGT